MISFNILIELVFSIIQLFADSPLGKPPQRRVAPYLMFIWNELDRLEGLLLFNLVIMGQIIGILGGCVGRHLGGYPGSLGGLHILLLYSTLLLECYWEALGFLGRFNFTGETITMLSLLLVGPGFLLVRLD